MGSFLPSPSNVPVSVSGDWEPLVNVNAAGNNGYNAVSLTNWDGATLAPALAQGSMIEIAGSIAFFATQEAIGGAATGVNYLRFTVAGSTVTPVWSLVAPVWNAAKNGWYNGAIRYSGHACYFASAAYSEKHEIQKPNNLSMKTLLTTYTGTIIQIPHHITGGNSKIYSISAFAFVTANNLWYDLTGARQQISKREIFLTWTDTLVSITDLDSDTNTRPGRIVVWYYGP